MPRTANLLVSSSIPALNQGISQQPYFLRLESQCEMAVNIFPTLQEGLRRRPPTKHIAEIISTPVTDAYIHTINRDTIERYSVVMTNGDLKVFDIVTGAEKTVAFPNGKAYLTATDPRNSFDMITVADYSFLVNKSIEVLEDSTTAASRDPEGYVGLVGSNYGKDFTITFDGTGVTVSLPDGATASDIDDIALGNIADVFEADGTFATWPVTRYGDSFYFTQVADFTLESSDDFNDVYLKSFKDKVASFEELPGNLGVDGFTIRIDGGVEENFKDYWMAFESTSGTKGVWKEAVEPGVKIEIDKATMPHTLVRETDGTFTFAEAAWLDRTVGSLESNPWPSFVGRKINGLFFHKNRLGCIADESVIMSEAGGYFNFFRTSTTTLLDSDPIDVTTTHSKVSILRHAVPYNKKLLLFSDQTQFEMPNSDLLTPKTAKIDPSTGFSSYRNCKPVGLGKNVFSAFNRGGYSGFREFFVDPEYKTDDAAEITAHIPSLIPKNTYKIAAAVDDDMLITLSEDQPNKFWLYRYYWNGNQKVLSSWIEQELPTTDTILGADFIDSDLYLTISRADGVSLEKISYDLADIGQGETFNIHLDRKHYVNDTELTLSAGYTVFTNLPYDVSSGTWRAHVADGQPEPANTLLDVEWTGSQARVPGDWTNCDLIIGRTYTTSFKFSTLSIKDSAPNNNVSRQDAEIKLRNMTVYVDAAGYFEAKVNPGNDEIYVYKYTGTELGTPTSTAGELNISEETSFRFPIGGKNTSTEITLETDSSLPLTLLSADWEGAYVRRANPI